MLTGIEMKMSTVIHLVSRPEAAPAVDRLRQLPGQRAVAAAGLRHRRQAAREVRHRVPAHAQPLHRRTRHLPRLHHLQVKAFSARFSPEGSGLPPAALVEIFSSSNLYLSTKI